MGIKFDARKFDSRKSDLAELSNDYEILRIRDITIDAISNNAGNYSITQKSSKLKIKGSGNRGQDETMREIQLSGDFSNFNIAKPKTWSKASIVSVKYEGQEGKINIVDANKSGNLLDLKQWNKLGKSKFTSKIFAGDDLIYSTKKDFTDHYLAGHDGNDEIILYSEEAAYGGKGADLFRIASPINKKLNAKIFDAKKSDGDVVFVEAAKESFPYVNRPEFIDKYDNLITYSASDSLDGPEFSINMNIYDFSSVEPTFSE
jgi:hypothetical protein